MTLAFHHLGVCSLFGEVQHFENVPVIAGLDRRRPLDFPEMVDAEIVGNPHGPGKEFTLFRVTAAANRVNNLNENILENIFCEIFVFNQEKNGSVQLILMTDNQCFKSMQVAVPELMNKFVVSLFA